MQSNDENAPLLGGVKQRAQAAKDKLEDDFKIGKGKVEDELKLERPFGCKDEGVILLEDDDAVTFNSCINAYEPLTKRYRAQNPTPLLLLAMHLGTACMALLELMGGFAFLTINAEMVFPKCNNYRVIDSVLKTDTGHGWLCEISSLALWTFPLVCAIFVPFFHYWDFCDTRLFYESIRNDLMIHFSTRPFFTNAIVMYLGVHFMVGMSVFIFGAPTTKEGWMNMLRGVIPFLIPIVSFFITTYVTWDIKFFLITLSNFNDPDPTWAKKHLLNCSSASEGVVMYAYQNLVKKGKLPHGAKSPEFFLSIRNEVEHIKVKHAKQIEDGTIGGDDEIPEEWPMERIKALLFWQPGFWVLDLLWSPQDIRASQFRSSFRTFGAAVAFLEALIFFMIVCVVLTYFDMQRHIDLSTWGAAGRVFSIEPFMINH